MRLRQYFDSGSSGRYGGDIWRLESKIRMARLKKIWKKRYEEKLKLS
jgi:hypothetical protein